MKYLVIAALFAATSAMHPRRIIHPSKENRVQFAEGMTDDDVDGYDFFAQQKRAEEAQAQQAPVSTAQLPTCDKFETWNCQPVCTESLTTGCTEARTPNAPYRDRYEGRRTFKGPEKSESPWSTL